MRETTIILEGNINDRLPSMRHLVENLSPLYTLGDGDSVVLDLSKLHYIGPDGIVMIAGSLLDARRRHLDVRVRTPLSPPPLAAFFEFSGFNHWIFGAVPAEMDHPENVTVPLRRFDQSGHADPDPILNLIARFEPVSEDLRISLGVAVSECIQNVEDHAQSPIGAMGCARFLTRDRQVRVALIDWGVGILKSLRRRYADIADGREALRRVLHGGYSAMTRINNQGRGINNLRAVITEAFGGDLFIVSGNAAVDIRGRASPRYYRWSIDFPGTAVCFTLPVQPRV